MVPVFFVLLENFWYNNFIVGGAPHRERMWVEGETRVIWRWTAADGKAVVKRGIKNDPEKREEKVVVGDLVYSLMLSEGA